MKNKAVIAALSLGSPAKGESLQRWLYSALRQAILDGRLPAKAVLPGSRSLAAEYRIARGTVQAAYAQLLSEGFLEAYAGSGTRISASLPDLAVNNETIAARAELETDQPRLRTNSWIQFLQNAEPAFPIATNKVLPVFSPHRADVSEFPMDVWRKLYARHLRPSKPDLVIDSDPAGLPELRKAIAQYLGIARGVSVSADNIVVLSSVQQALDICLRLLVNRDEQVWMEDPGYMGARQLMQAADIRVVDVNVDCDGMQIETAIKAAPDARLAYITPARQSPLGVSLSPERRLALLQWAKNNNAYIFEDDYDSEYRFVAKPIPTLKSLPGANEYVVLAGTFSKLLFSGIRLAFVVPPPHLLNLFIRAASLTSRHANALTQAVLADFILEGNLDRHIRRMRRIYTRRAQTLQNAAQKYWSGLINLSPIEAGLDVVGYLIGIDEQLAVQHLSAAGIGALPLSKYKGNNSLAPGLVIGFAAFNEEAIEQSAEKMGIILRELQKNPVEIYAY